MPYPHCKSTEPPKYIWEGNTCKSYCPTCGRLMLEQNYTPLMKVGDSHTGKLKDAK